MSIEQNNANIKSDNAQKSHSHNGPTSTEAILPKGNKFPSTRLDDDIPMTPVPICLHTDRASVTQNEDDDTPSPVVLKNRSRNSSFTILPLIQSARKLIEHNLALPSVVVQGLLHQGSKMVLGGGSKSFKTWCLCDLAISVANGKEWWGLETNQGRVLYINFEIQEGFFARRLDEISAAKGLTLDALDNLDVWNLRGYCADLSQLMDKLLGCVHNTFAVRSSDVELGE